MLLGGIFRKLSLPVLLLSLAGYVTYVVGFGFRNVSYMNNTDTTAAAPDYIFFWLYLCTGPILYILACIQSIWDSKISAFLAVIVAPAFLLSLGAVLFFNGLQIYNFFRLDNQPPRDINLVLFDALDGINDTYTIADARNGTVNATSDIIGEQRYITIEFAGTLASVFFYWIYVMMVPFFTTKSSNDPHGYY